MQSHRTVSREIKELKRIMLCLPQNGKHNKPYLAAQIRVLEELLDEGECWEAYPDEDDELHANAIDAVRWLHQDADFHERPSASWHSLCPPPNTRKATRRINPK